MTTTSYRYLHLDVFTGRVFNGNQLAVFPNAIGLSDAIMQAIAREMAFSETTFVLPRVDDRTDVRMRIFTPASELPMAGHPTIGTAFALAHEGVIEQGRPGFVFGLGVGPVPVALEWRAGRLGFAWMTQLLPRFGPPVEQVDAVAAALGLAVDASRATGLPVQEVSCGVPFLLVPIATRRAVDAAIPDPRALAAGCDRLGLDRLPVYLFSTEPGDDGADVYTRMFAPELGVMEDPATGSASGPLGAYLVRHGVVPHNRAGQILNVQGVKMGRPSRIHIAIGLDRDAITSVRVGGEAVFVGEGMLRSETPGWP